MQWQGFEFRVVKCIARVAAWKRRYGGIVVGIWMDCLKTMYALSADCLPGWKAPLTFFTTHWKVAFCKERSFCLLDTWTLMWKEEAEWAPSPVTPGLAHPTSCGIFANGSKAAASWVSSEVRAEITSKSLDRRPVPAATPRRPGHLGGSGQARPPSAANSNSDRSSHCGELGVIPAVHVRSTR